MRVSSLFVLLILTEIHFVTSRFPKKPIRAITINEATDKDDLQTQIFTFVDLGFNFIFLGYGQDKNVAGKKVSAPIGALKYYFEISRTDRLLLKSYIASKGVKLIYAMGGPTQPMEKVIKEIGGYSWANQNILRAAEFGFDGFFMDLYFKPRDNCERLLKDDLCMVKNDEKCKKVEDIYHDDDSDKYTYYSSFLELMLEQLVDQPKFTSSALFGYSLPASAFRSDLELGFSNFLLPRTSLELTDLHENKQCQENLSALAYDYTAEEYEEFLQQPNHLLCGIELTLPKHKLRENHIPMPNAVFNEKNIKTGKGLYYDFIIPRYFTGGDCYSNYLSDIDKISQLSNYSSYTRIFDDKHNLFDYNLTANIPSDWRSNNLNLIRNQTNESSESSIEGISNSYKYNFDQERYVGKAENELKEANFQQYAKSRIIPGFTLENEVLDTRYPDSNKMIANSDEYISLDNLTNWSCLKRKFDIQFQSEDYNFWSDKANSKYKQLTGNETEIKFNHTNIYVPQYAFFTGSMGFEDLRMGVLERFMVQQVKLKTNLFPLANFQLSNLIFLLAAIILFQLPIVTFYYKSKRSYQKTPDQINYYEDLSIYLKHQLSDIINAENFTNSYLKVPTSQGYINFDEFRQKVEAVSDQNQKQQYILQRPTYVSPAKIARERKALNKINQIESETILSDVTNTFINLLAQNKIILSSTSEILSAKSDLLSRVTKEIQEKINHAVEGEDKRLTDGQISQDLSELLEDIYSEYDRNKTKIEFYNKFFRPAYLKSNQELCNKVPSNLVGLLRIDFDMAQPTENQIDIKFAEKFHQGGHYVPSEMCKPKFRVAIVIPYRDRYEHLMYFLWYLHPILQRQDIEYKIYVINQLGTTPFNRAQLLNIGFVESLKDYKYWDCFIFHDVDLVPENDHMLYHCPILPRHMSVAVDKFRYQLPYSTIFGGATAFTKSQFLTLNGYSNKFSGWGGEDDDMFRRLYLAQIDIQRPDGKIGRYRMIRHKKDDTNKANPDRFKLLKSVKSRWKMDGLNNLMETYRRISVDEHYSFTIINIQVIG